MKASFPELARRRLVSLPGPPTPELQQAKADFIEAVISRKYRAAQAANALSPNMRDLNLRRRRLSVRSATRLW